MLNDKRCTKRRKNAHQTKKLKINYNSIIFIYSVIIMATRTQNVLGERGRRIRELTALVQKRFGFAQGQVELYAEKVSSRGLCAVAQCESLRYKLVGGLAVRRACYGVLRFIMESEARGCEIVVSGKIRGQRAKAMKVCFRPI
jgi:small subunit ribosomal protein S3e